MSRRFSKFSAMPALLIAFTALTIIQPASAATPYTCTLNAAVTPTVRAEGMAELLGDMILNCFGGVPTAAGSTVPTADIRLTLGTLANSRAVSGSFTETLLLIDDPHSASHPSIPLLPCGAASSGDNGSGVCSITSADSTGAATYNGTAGHPNVFQAQLEASNVLVWKSIPIDPPGSNNSRIFRFTNVRGNAVAVVAGWSNPNPLIPPQAGAQLSVTPATALPMSNSQQTLAFVAPKMKTTLGTPATFNQCTAANPAIAADATKALETGAQNGAQFTVRVEEPFPAAWREKNIQYHLNKVGTGSPVSPPSDVAQDVPGANYFSESGFLANGVPSVGTAPQGYGPFLTTNQSVFPSLHGLELAGKADSGTRIYVKFTSVPAGVAVALPMKVSVVIRRYPGTDPRVEDGVAVLTSAQSDGSGAFKPVDGNTSGLAVLTPSNGNITAVYEVVYTNPFQLEYIDIPVAFAYASDGVQMPRPGTIEVETGFAPVTTTATIIPRFDAPTGSPQTAATIEPCGPGITVVAATPRGAPFLVDGATYTTSQQFRWTAGSTHTIAAPSSTTNAGVKYTFNNWSDKGAVSHSITAPDSGDAMYIAVIDVAYRLTTDGTSIMGTVTPASGGFYPEGSIVNVLATPAPGYLFQQWVGPVGSSMSPATTVKMTGPLAISAMFSPREPYRLPQVIYFDSIPDHMYGDAPFTISARSESTLPVSFSVVSGPARLNGNTVTLTGTGTVTIRASQSGNTIFDAAPDVDRSFRVNAPAQRPILTITTVPSAAGVVTASPSAAAYDYGTRIQLTAKPNPGYVFVGFSGDLTGAATPQNLEMTSNRAVTANFAPVAPARENSVVFGVQSGVLPAAESIPLDAPGPITMFIMTTTGGNWLRASVAGSPAALSLSVASDVVRSLPRGEYSGHVIVSSGSWSRVMCVSLAVDSARITRATDGAGFTSQSIATGGLGTIFGVNLSQGSSVEGLTLTITSPGGAATTAPLTYASPTQINFVVPSDVQPGPVILTLKNAAGQSASIPAQCANIAPSLFDSAILTRVNSDGEQTGSTLTGNPLPVDFGSAGDAVYLTLYGTGLRNRASAEDVSVRAGETPLEVLYAGPQGHYEGLDQINVRVPAALAGAGLLDLNVTISGVASNALRINAR